MTRLGFGAVAANSFDVDGLTPTSGTTIVASPFTGGGPLAIRAVASTFSVNASSNPSLIVVSGRGYYMRARVRVSAAPSADTLLLGYGGGTIATTSTFGVGLASGSLALRLFGGGSVRGSAGPTLSVNTDYLLEVHALYNTAGDDTLAGRVDGTQFETFTGAMTATLPTAIFLGPSANAAITSHYTDWAVNDDQGSDNNSWCGDARTALLVPTSDDTGNSEIGADAWRVINSGSTNLWQAVDNAPPIGAASPGSGTSQLVCDTPSANRQYVGVTAAYSSQIAAGDTITLIQAIGAHGEAVSTGSKTGFLWLFANPDDLTNALSITYGADAGAAGTFPATWTISRAPVVVSPSVTRGTGVSLAIQQDTSTRNGMACFLGAYVEYTVAAAEEPPRLRPAILGQAVKTASLR